MQLLYQFFKKNLPTDRQVFRECFHTFFSVKVELEVSWKEFYVQLGSLKKRDRLSTGLSCCSSVLCPGHTSRWALRSRWKY